MTLARTGALTERERRGTSEDVPASGHPREEEAGREPHAGANV